MNEIILLLKILAFALTGFYFLLILVYLISWLRIKEFFSSSRENKVFASIIVAARNEEKSIEQCLQHLIKQNYLPNLFEIIVVNDFSEDETKQVVETFIQNHKEVSIKLINLQDILKIKNGSKKEAITEAVKNAKGELIITTDADCTMNINWLKTIADYYEMHQPYLISSPVVFAEKNMFEKIQSLEFISLISTGAAAIKSGFPLMCNAANLAFKKEIYFEVGRDAPNNEPFSGDDTFLMFAIKNKYPRKIAFLKSKAAIVTTQPQTSLRDFINQRKRWSSKVKSYTQNYVKWIGVVSFLFNTMLLFSGITALFDSSFLRIFIIQLSAKLLIDFLFLFSVTGFFNKRSLLFLFFPVEVLYVFYIIFISLMTFSESYEWKNRKIKV